MIRVRFAPSPTGHLHVGGIRTALFNWLFAKKENGTFVLRIEDTDTKRSTVESEIQIMDSMKWCGLTWDEGPDKPGYYGPYKQAQRFDENIYSAYVDKLIKEKKAYYTVYDTVDEEKEIGNFEDEIPAELSENKYTIKFKVPEGSTKFFDILKKDMSFDNSLIDDFIIVKSNGMPVYNFAVVIDDHLMKITHVFRGEDHLTNTPRQVMLYQALDLDVPVFMHIPLILGEDRSPLSKRHGGTSAEFFRKEGYLNTGLMNYLALLGWSVDDEFFDPTKEIDKFTLDRISNKSVIFDYRKLEWVNGKHIRNTSPLQLKKYFYEWLSFCDEDYHKLMMKKCETLGEDYIEKAIFICIEKVPTLKQLAYYLEPIIYEKYDFEEKVIKKFLKKDTAAPILEKAIEKFDSLDIYNINSVESTLVEISEELSIGKSKVFQTIRGALTGRLVTPGLFELVELFGRARTVSRLKNTLDEVKKVV